MKPASFAIAIVLSTAASLAAAERHCDAPVGLWQSREAVHEMARERGWTGTAEVRVDVSPGGQPWQVLLARSSGHEVLDREAVLLMLNAAATTVLPDSLRGREFAVRMPVTFDIAEMQ